jgi:hypothetical protein
MTAVASRRVTALVGHEVPDRPPLRLAVGDHVAVGERDTEWPEFVFVTAAHGTGWVPARHLSQPSGSAVVEVAYDTAELPTRPGDLLDVLDEDLVGGWLWCRDQDDREGWVPVRTVQDDAGAGGH